MRTTCASSLRPPKPTVMEQAGVVLPRQKARRSHLRPLPPVGRGPRRGFNIHGWVRGCAQAPHPIFSVEPPRSPLPQGATGFTHFSELWQRHGRLPWRRACPNQFALSSDRVVCSSNSIPPDEQQSKRAKRASRVGAGCLRQRGARICALARLRERAAPRLQHARSGEGCGLNPSPNLPR